jgi:Ni,Fe-hydrogenase maturation factor
VIGGGAEAADDDGVGARVLRRAGDDLGDAGRVALMAM